MKAIILAGGKGTRLQPLTNWTNKHLLPVGSYPMICYGVAKLSEAGIKDIAIVTTRTALGDFAEVLGSGSDWGVSIVYRVQEEASGIAGALELARPVISSRDKFVVLLGDNLFEQSLTPFAETFEQQEDGAMVLLKEVEDPRRYGVPRLDEETGRILHIDEKPDDPASSYCVTGLYFYHADVFEVIGQMSPSLRGEMEITDVNNYYAHAKRLRYGVIDKWWTDAGTFESLEEAALRLKGTLLQR